MTASTDPLMVTGEPAHGGTPVDGALDLAGHGLLQTPGHGLRRPQGLGRLRDAQRLGAVGKGGDDGYVQSTVHAGPPAAVGVVTHGVPGGGVQVGGLDVHADTPPPATARDRREQDARPPGSDHAPQPAGIVVDLDRADAGQRDRPGTGLTETDRGPLASLGRGDLVAHAERAAFVALLLEPGMPDSAAGALAAPGVGPRLQGLAEIHHRFLEDLRRYLGAPGKAGDLQLRSTRAVDDEAAAGVLGLLPRVERIDQVKPGPRDLDVVDADDGFLDGVAGVQVQA